MKKFLALILALAMIFALAACGQSAAPAAQEAAPAAEEAAPAAEADASVEKVTLTMMNIWCGADSKTEGWTALVNAFNEEYAGQYEVILEDQADYDAYVEKMKALISTGDTPDLFTFKGDRLKEYCSTGNLMDFTDFAANSELSSRIDAGVFEAAQYEGSLYCIPYETAFIPLMFNTKLLDNAGVSAIPTSYDELYDACEKIASSGVYPIAQSTGSAQWFSQLWFSYCLASVMGANIYDKAFDSPEWIEAAKLYQTLTAHSEDDMIGSDTSVVNGNFFNERAAVYCNGTWIVGRLGSEGVPGLTDEIDVSGTLSYNGANGGGYCSVVQAYLAAAKTEDPNKQAAVEAFFEYVTRPELVLDLSKSSGALFTVNFDVSQLDPGLQTEIIDAASQAAFQFPTFQNSVSSQVYAAYADYIDALAMGTMTPEDFCAALAAA